MSLLDADTSKIVHAWVDGRPFFLDVEEVECGHLLDKRVAHRVREAIKAAREDGLSVSIISAWRSMEEQEHLYNCWRQGLKGYNPADQPGHSKHQEGLAIDLAFKDTTERERFAALAVAHGGNRPIHREPWHWVFTPSPEEST